MVSADRGIPSSSGLPSPGLRRERTAPIAGGGLPSWAGSGQSDAPARSAPAGSYEIDPDLGSAELGKGPLSPGAAPSGGAAVADAGGPTGGAPQAGSAAPTPDLGGGSSGSATARRSEARTLANRTRALSRQLGRLDQGGSANADASSESSKASTASGDRDDRAQTNNDPGTPGNPNQVPLGGAEYLAAAGAAYALNRLRKQNGEGEEEDEEA